MFSGFSKWSSLLLWIGFVVLLSSAVWAQVGAATAPPVATSPNLAAEAMKPDDSPSMLRPVLQDMGSFTVRTRSGYSHAGQSSARQFSH